MSMKVTSYAKFARKKKMKMRNKGRRTKRRMDGTLFKTNARTYIKAARHLRKPRRASTVLRMLRTKRRRSTRFGAAYGMKESQHNQLFIAAVLEVANKTNRADIAEALLTNIDPEMTNTRIGVLTLDIADAVMESKIGASLIDVTVGDATTGVFFFEAAEGVTAESLKTALGQHGTVTILAKPNDQIDDSTTSDVFIVAVQPTTKSLSETALDFDDNMKEETIQESENEDETLTTHCNTVVAMVESVL